MSEYLPFWPKAAIGAYVPNLGQTAVIFSRALPTNGFTEVVIQMEIDATFGAAVGMPNTTIDVDPQISNDGVNWQTLIATALSIPNNALFPAQSTEKFTEIGAFMRMMITITSQEVNPGMIVAPLLVSGAGRS